MIGADLLFVYKNGPTHSEVKMLPISVAEIATILVGILINEYRPRLYKASRH